MPPPIEERRPAITPQLAVRVAVLGGIAFVLFAVVFFRLWFLQVLTGEDYVSQARENRVRKIKIEAPRGNIVDRNGQVLVKTRVAPVVQIVPESLPAAELEAAEAYRQGRVAAETRRLAAARELASLRERLRADGRRSTKARAARAPPAGAQGRPRGARAGRSDPGRRAGAAQPLQAAGHGHPPAAARDPPRGHRGHRRGALLQRDDQDRRRQGRVLLPARAPGGVPRRRGREALPAPLPLPRARRAALRHPARDLPGRAQAARATAAWRPARASARTGSRRPTTATCAGSTATRAWSSTRSATATTRARPRSGARSRASSCASRSTSACSGRRTTRWRGPSRPPT